ncbi:hypothetical protein Bca52824_073519 [Brassica carinata]|uniref:Uncharacterized protein n=1 Tax=Brassica carinata TaxID=52824 RepID=A0A8X7QD69_BRACI|nr:hypothetical protein Bca52824_073519 [Brassica carinata]
MVHGELAALTGRADPCHGPSLRCSTEVSGSRVSLTSKPRRLKENSFGFGRRSKNRAGDRLSSIRALVRVERRGKRAIVAEMKRRSALFATN